ncbi:MAG: fluoride efflux transporter CrcB [SAR324 cluster bacterium]
MGYLIVTVGGGIGALARYVLSTWVHTLTGAAFPWGTLAVNALGSFIIGLVMVLSLERAAISPEVRLLLTTGFCGGLTTFSTFSYETLSLIRAEQWLWAGANTVGNVMLCCLATALGLVAGRMV